MPPFAGLRTGEGYAGAHLAPRLVQAFDEIVRQKRAITRNTEDPFNAALLLCQPVQSCENPGQWAGEIRHAIGHNSEAGIGETLRISVGVDNDTGALRG